MTRPLALAIRFLVKEGGAIRLMLRMVTMHTLTVEETASTLGALRTLRLEATRRHGALQGTQRRAATLLLQRKLWRRHNKFKGRRGALRGKEADARVVFGTMMSTAPSRSTAATRGNCAKRERILDVVYSATSNELVRTKTLTENTIMQIDARPFEQFYLKDLGKKKTIRPELGTRKLPDRGGG